MKDQWPDSTAIERATLAILAATLLGIFETVFEFLPKAFSKDFCQSNTQTNCVSSIDETLEK
jgi:hypothetical protein